MFGLPGVQMYGLFDALARNANRIQVINARHEQTTAYMALGYACATGKPAVYAVVPGPGVLNTTAALSTAWSVNAPVLCLTGQVPSSQIGRLRGQLHELPDQLATLRTLVRHAERIEDPTEAPRKVARAFQEMMSGRPSPAALEIPLDQLPAEAEVTSCDPFPRHPNPVPDSAKIARLAEMIDAARNPMIWVGAGAMDAGAEIRALAERIGAPVVRYRGGRGILDDRHPLSLTVPEGFRLWPETDLLIGFGTRLDVPTARWGKLPDGIRIARIDIDPAEMRRLTVDLGIVADAADAARALTATVARRDDPDRAATIARLKAETAAEIQSVQPQMSFLEAIRDALPEDGIFCDEMTQVGYVSAFGMPFHAPRTAIGSGFSGNLG
ncbi:thiamine pyrophosphate-binding protein, partial [Elioraea sp.]|uniref:thiamine pyrophosphate-binding protein n=1 Tax=Elioraea sp. TaxID=2185103 RepID=UPI003F730013